MPILLSYLIKTYEADMLYKMLFLLARTDWKYSEGGDGLTGIIIIAVIAFFGLFDYWVHKDDNKNN